MKQPLHMHSVGNYMYISSCTCTFSHCRQQLPRECPSHLNFLSPIHAWGSFPCSRHPKQMSTMTRFPTKMTRRRKRRRNRSYRSVCWLLWRRTAPLWLLMKAVGSIKYTSSLYRCYLVTSGYLYRSCLTTSNRCMYILMLVEFCDCYSLYERKLKVN